MSSFPSDAAWQALEAQNRALVAENHRLQTELFAVVEPHTLATGSPESGMTSSCFRPLAPGAQPHCPVADQLPSQPGAGTDAG